MLDSLNTVKWKEQQINAFENACKGSIGKLPDLSAFDTTGIGRLGIGMECLDRDLWDCVPALPALKVLGIKRARLQSGWAKTERTPGVFDFKWLDDIVDNLLKINVQPWLSLSYGNPLYAIPGEDSRTDGIGTNPLHSQQGRDAWERYIRTTIRHFQGRISVYEIWNEPDISIFFPVRQDSNWIMEYIELARLTSAVIRQEAPTAKVVSVTACGATPKGCRSIAKLLENGLGKLADIHAFHNYRKQPERFNHAVQQSFYGLFRKYAPNMKVWRGEAGIASSNPPGGRGALCNVPVSEDVQVRWLARHVIRDLADAGLDMSSYFHLFDFEHFTHKYTYHYGILRDGDYSPKPSYQVLQRLKFLLDDGNTVPDDTIFMECSDLDEATTNAVHVSTFRRNGYPLYAFWNANDICANDAPIKTTAICFDGTSTAVWKNPVLLDSFTGLIAIPQMNPDNGDVAVPLMDHPLFLTEMDALAPFIASTDSNSDTPKDFSTTQAHHE